MLLYVGDTSHPCSRYMVFTYHVTSRIPNSEMCLPWLPSTALESTAGNQKVHSAPLSVQPLVLQVWTRSWLRVSSRRQRRTSLHSCATPRGSPRPPSGLTVQRRRAPLHSHPRAPHRGESASHPAPTPADSALVLHTAPSPCLGIGS